MRRKWAARVIADQVAQDDQLDLVAVNVWDNVRNESGRAGSLGAAAADGVSDGDGDLLKIAFQAVLLLFASVAAAAELDGVAMPDMQDVAGYHLVLNGVGLRTYSLLRVHIYVVGL